MYSNEEKNEQSIDIRQPGRTEQGTRKGSGVRHRLPPGARPFIPCENEADSRAMYMMCTRRSRQAGPSVWPDPLSPEANAALPSRVFWSDHDRRNEGSVPEPDWFGLVVDNRQLFNALQDGWLRPIAPRAGVPVGVGSFVRAPDSVPENRIPIRVRVDTAKLPDIEVHVFRRPPFGVLLPVRLLWRQTHSCFGRASYRHRQSAISASSPTNIAYDS